MVFCKKCGVKVESDADFCVSCGTLVTITGQQTSDKQPEENDAFKTQIRKKNIYGLVNLENIPEGHVIDDRYEVKEKLGQGGFGAVYRAFDKKMEIDKALKVLPEAIISDLEAMDSLKAEAMTMVRLNHPNIVRVYDFQDQGEIKYIDMEFVDGKSLTEVKMAADEKKLSEKAVLNLGKKIAKGLSYAHSQNVIHRDIKPQNILVSKTGDVKIMDFGISETVKSSMSRIANSGSSGTLVYMSPEQIIGKDVGKEADIYSFGAMLYELLSGKPPFHKGAIEHQILNIEAQPIVSVSAHTNSMLQRCLAKDFKDRYKEFDEVQKVLGVKTVKSSATVCMEPKKEVDDQKKISGVTIVESEDDNQERSDRGFFPYLLFVFSVPIFFIGLLMIFLSLNEIYYSNLVTMGMIFGFVLGIIIQVYSIFILMGCFKCIKGLVRPSKLSFMNFAVFCTLYIIAVLGIMEIQFIYLYFISCYFLLGLYYLHKEKKMKKKYFSKAV